MSDQQQPLTEERRRKLIADLGEIAAAIPDADLRALMIGRCVQNHAHGDPEVLAAAEIMVGAAYGRGLSPAVIHSKVEQPAVVDSPAPLAEQPSEPAMVLVDVELMRILGALGHGVIARIYAAGQQMTRDSSGSGSVDEHELLTTLIQWEMQSSYKNLRKYLDKGDGVLWDWDQKRNRLYLYSPTRMTRHGLRGRLNAVQMALDAGRPELVITNAPGTKLMLVPFAGSMLVWYGNILAAWHNSRADHTQNISRYTLCLLWGASKKTLITWEKAASIEAVKCYAQYTEFEQVPVKHAFPYLAEVEQADGTKETVLRAKARHSNLYNAPSMKEHQHRRSPRERRRASKFVLEAATYDGNPNGACDATAASCSGVGFIEPTGRRNFHANDGDLPKAFKRLKGHLKRHGSDATAHYVRIGYDGGRSTWVYEQSNGVGQQTTIDEQLPRAAADKLFAAYGGRAAIVQAWREMAS